MDKDELYQTLLDGLARYTGHPLIGDVLRTVSRYPDPNLAHSLNKNQVASKKWLVTELMRATAPPLGTVYVLGGWYGVLSAMLLNEDQLGVRRAVSIDIDPGCAPVAMLLNRRHVEQGRFLAVTRDMAGLDYRSDRFEGPDGRGGTAEFHAPPDLVINTSCEHLNDFPRWYNAIPAGTLLVLQSNDYFACEEHVNCVPDLAAFRQQAPMSELLYADRLPLKRYTRFMLIGRRG
jgi:hypothetical protein